MADTQLLTCDELASRSRISKSMIYRLVAADRLPHFQPAGKGGKLLFPLDAIERAGTANTLVQTDDSSRPQSGRRPLWTQD